MNLETIDLSGDLKLVANILQSSSRDIEKFYLPSETLIALLERIKIGEVDRELVAVVSDLLEMNDSVVIEKGKEKAIADTLFFLSGPEINGYPDSAQVSRLISLLEEK